MYNIRNFNKKLDIRDFFNLTCEDILCNTSYPIRAEFFSQYKTDKDIMNGTSELSFYFHIPFCKSLCKFCEYTRFFIPNLSMELDYIRKLRFQTQKFLATHQIDSLYGLDIGGGTPTALSTQGLQEFLQFIQTLICTLPLEQNFEPSMEFSFQTIDEQKIDIIAEHGIQRLSSGIQVFDTQLMSHFDRTNSSLRKMSRTLRKMRETGIKKINLDLMYGFENQDKTMLDNSIHAIEELQPNQVTLYEMRYNHNRLGHSRVNRETLFEQYSYLFQKIRALGFNGNFGQNTFSLFDDFGVSSYIRSRMLDCIPYKGFGISAQSMSFTGISYNILKSSMSTSLPVFDEIKENDIYLLPDDEIAAKYVCIALYSGQFNLDVLSKILKSDASQIFAHELNFITENQFAYINGNICRLTEKGFKVYGAIASLFWSNNHKKLYLGSK